MAVSRLSHLKPLSSHLRAVISTCPVPTVPRHHQQLTRYLVQSRMLSSNKTRTEQNVIYARHEDCFLPNQTVVQRFFDRAALWPNLVAMVKP